MSDRIVTGRVFELPNGKLMLGMDDQTYFVNTTAIEDVYSIVYQTNSYWAIANENFPIPVVLIPKEICFDEDATNQNYEVKYNSLKKRFEVKYHGIIYYFNLETKGLESDNLDTPHMLPPLSYSPTPIVFEEG